MLYVATKNFLAGMDKFPSDAAKIIDQSESFLVCVFVCGGGGRGGEFRLSSRSRT